MATKRGTGRKVRASPRTKQAKGRGRAKSSGNKKAAGPGPKRWSQRVTERSDAMDLEGGVFAKDDPAAVARSLKRSAERSQRRKASPYQSAMSMLNFFINRAGKQLSEARRRLLERAKIELRALFHRPQRA